LLTTHGATGETFGTMKSGSLMTGESCGKTCIVEITPQRDMSGESCRENIGM
jgi:hypothetical protein